MTVKDFSVASIELTKGSHLIEASAGTGKTYTIAMLVLRFIAEQGITIENILVVTFTKAATAELKERIRFRILQGQQALSGCTEGLDNNVVEWVKNLSLDKQKVRQRLENALLNIDQAGIFTIHGFCQRALKEFALESGQLFDCELTSDDSQLRLQIAEDYWREQVYSRPLWAVSVLTQVVQTPEQLLQSIDGVGVSGSVYPQVQDLELILARIEQNLMPAKVILPSLFQILNDVEQIPFFKKPYLENLDAYYQSISAWLHQQDIPLPDTALATFTLDGIKAGLNGGKFRAKGGISGEQRKQEYLDGLSLDTTGIDQLQQAVASTQLMFRRNLVERLRSGLEQKLQQLNLLSFDNLIFRLSEALQESGNELLKAGLKQRYQVALIDEFQDTDQAQWYIFSTLFAGQKHSLYLIGDPKQAIYKFRGADVFSYLQASQSAQYHFSLNSNWRSHPNLVNAVNKLFIGRPEPFWLPQLGFNLSQSGLTTKQGELQKNNKPLAPMALWQLAECPEHAEGYWGVASAAEAMRISVVNEIVELLDQKHRTSLVFDNHHQSLQPKDIAILVRTNSQARDYQIELHNAGVPSVLNSTESVFSAYEAKELYRFLEAIIQPGNIGLLKQAMTLTWFNLDGQDLFAMGNDEQVLDQWLIRFQGYYQTWQKLGLMAMMHQVLTLEAVEINLAKSSVAERKLTNIHHLIELTQQAVIENHLGLQKTLEWLQQAITEESNSEEKQLRLESDEQAVKIITMHRCKGLEFAVVFCPVLWHRSTRLAQENNLIRCHENGEIITDLGSERFLQRKELAIKEELSEDLRLLYVAVTRAKYRCYLTWADVRTKNNPNISALAYLLFTDKVDGWQQDLANVEFSGQQQKLQALAEQEPASFSYHLLAADQEIKQYYSVQDTDETLSARNRQRTLSNTWRMTSYTALSALSIDETPELPGDKAQEITPETNTLGLSVEAIPRGAHTGNVIHELLENIVFTRLAKLEDISIARDQACQRYGLILEQPAVIDSLLNKVVLTPLSASDPDFCLANLPAQHCLKELPFVYAFNTINSADINTLLADSSDFKSLSRRKMQGFLTGFIDLVCQYRGKFYVMDYKTNGLENYHQETMTEAMRDHNYGLQYWIYSVVLHQYLQKRLADYQYQKHFGGVRYLFVRGMEPEQPESGVCSRLPDLATLDELTRFFRA